MVYLQELSDLGKVTTGAKVAVGVGMAAIVGAALWWGYEEKQKKLKGLEEERKGKEILAAALERRAREQEALGQKILADALRVRAQQEGARVSQLKAQENIQRNVAGEAERRVIAEAERKGVVLRPEEVRAEAEKPRPTVGPWPILGAAALALAAGFFWMRSRT